MPYQVAFNPFSQDGKREVEVRDEDGRVGWGEGHISPGSSRETREGGWAFCREHAAAVVGKDTTKAKAIIASKVANGQVVRTRPLCPYPQVAKYKGQGSIDDAANFSCAVP